MMALSFAGAGLATAVGGCFEQTASSIRSGIIRLSVVAPDDKEPEKLVFCARVQDDYLPPLAPQLGDQLAASPRTARCLQLAHLALNDMAGESLDETPLVLGLPEPVDGLEPLHDDFRELLEAQSGVRFNHGQDYAYGQAGGLAAFNAASALIEQGTPRVLLGGVDCLSQPHSLAVFDRSDRIMRLGEPYGYVPGEGAGFVLLEAGSDQALQIHPPGFAQVSADHGPEGDGDAESALGKAMRAAINNASVGKIAVMITPLSGEQDRTDEWGQACSGLGDYLPLAPVLLHPAHQFGDLGAAQVPVLLALAADGLAQAYLPAPVLLCGVAAGSYRAAVVVDKPGNGPDQQHGGQ